MNKWIFFAKNIHFHPLFWLIATIAIITARFQELLILFFIVLVHELGHATAAHYFSWRIKKIILLPFGGVVELDEHGNRPLKEELIVLLAGPIQHFWLFLLAKMLFLFTIISEKMYMNFIEYNLMILLFNCLPILPLDGGKLMQLLFAKYFPYAEALKKAILSSFLFLLFYCLAIIFIFPLHLNGWVIAIFLFQSLYKDWKNRPYVVMRFLLERHSNDKKPKRKSNLFVSVDDTIQSVIEQFQRDVHHTILVYEQNKIVEKINERKVLNQFFGKNSLQLKIKEILTR